MCIIHIYVRLHEFARVNISCVQSVFKIDLGFKSQLSLLLTQIFSESFAGISVVYISALLSYQR